MPIKRAQPRETPAPNIVGRRGDDAAFPAAPAEPILALHEIQGNIVGGFNKDFQHLIFLSVTEPTKLKSWLASLLPRIATAAEVIAFNHLFKTLRRRRGDTPDLRATWINIAFTHEGISKLLPTPRRQDPGETFTDAAFREGLAARSAALNDPQGSARGSPKRWKVGGPTAPVDLVLIIADDDGPHLDIEVAEPPRLSGAKVVFQERGAVLPGDLRGHEHFGFLDGVSQPGIRGRLSSDPHDLLTPRQNPNDADQGKPGQDLLWPGEFVFGYPGQRADAEDIAEPGEVTSAGPAWTVNGSFLVFRRLEQDVPLFHTFLRDQGKKLGIDPELLGAMLVGRWRSGAPFLRTPLEDNRDLGNDDCANNHFEFREDGEPIHPHGSTGSSLCEDHRFSQAQADPHGKLLPLVAHIRRTYPRDDESSTQRTDVQKRLNEADVQTHRLLRRGIPFGPTSPSSISSQGSSPEEKDVERGLHFLAYMTSIEEQFEFVTKSWVNEADFKDDGVGEDPIIGQSARKDRERKLKVSWRAANGKLRTQVIRTKDEWVTPTGGGYFFAPSISALGMFAER